MDPALPEFAVFDCGRVQVLRCGILMIAIDDYGLLLDVALYADEEVRRVSSADMRRLGRNVAR